MGTQDGVKSVETNLNDPNAESELKEEDDSKIKVYTATYYIGLEINTGKSIVGSLFRSRCMLTSVKKYQSRSISHGRARNSLIFAKIVIYTILSNIASTFI